MPRVLFSHSASLGHDTGQHPESPARILAIEQELARRPPAGWRRLESPRATQEALVAVHALDHLTSIEALAQRGGGMVDMDTVVSPRSWEAALHAAGGAVAVVDALLGDNVPAAASIHRPPGHHCEAERPMGFCLLNNVAVAAQHAVGVHGCARVMIVDWDVHHGNGTNDIFADSDAVLFTSLHQSPLYPGTGHASDVGRGRGEGFTVNVPMSVGSGDAEWLAVFDHVLGPVGRAFDPDLILISAGFDAHVDDPLAGCAVTDDGFVRMASAVAHLGRDVAAPVGLVLEGGYNVEALARSVRAVLDVLSGHVRPTENPAEITAHAHEARARASSFWTLP